MQNKYILNLKDFNLKLIFNPCYAGVSIYFVLLNNIFFNHEIIIVIRSNIPDQGAHRCMEGKKATTLVWEGN